MNQEQRVAIITTIKENPKVDVICDIDVVQSWWDWQMVLCSSGRPFQFVTVSQLDSFKS
jgi:hypothetical protein